MPDIALRTTFIVGYPGETEEQFQTLLDFLAEMQFDHVGAFTYCNEPGTRAALLPDDVPAEVKQERYARLMETQRAISLAKNRALVGQTLDVLIEGEGEVEDEDGTTVPISAGRAKRHAPEVDGLVFVAGVHPIGSIIPVRITEADEYDLWGEAPEFVAVTPRAASARRRSAAVTSDLSLARHGGGEFVPRDFHRLNLRVGRIERAPHRVDRALRGGFVSRTQRTP